MKSLSKLKLIRIIIVSIISALLLIFAAFYIYTLDYYRASDYVEQKILDSKLIIEVVTNKTIIHPSENSDNHKAIIFYPGGKVEAKAYMPLLLQLAEKGITCILIKMPMNLAIFNTNGADEVYDQFPEIEKWYLAGHSLGGAMASSYMENNYKYVDGLILLGAYPINDAPVKTLAIYGTHDIKLDLNKLSSVANVIEVLDGNHANFGDYGEQEGDGVSLISRVKQQSITVEAIMEFIKN